MQLENTDLETEQQRALATLNSLVLSQEKGDINLFSKCFDHNKNLTVIGTDYDEYWQNWDDFYKYMQQLIELRKDLKISTKKTVVNIHQSGYVAWYSQLIDTSIESKGEAYLLEGFRHTGVMVQQNGDWKIVQSHMSVAIEEDFDDLLLN